MKTEEIDLILKRKEMSKAAWIKNVLRIYPDKTVKETEELWQKLFKADQSIKIQEGSREEMEKDLPKQSKANYRLNYETSHLH